MRRTTSVPIICILFLAAAAQAGELARVACDPSEATGAQMLYGASQNFTKPKEAVGLVNAQAVAVSFPGRGTNVQVAVDSAKADATAADLLRFDFTGQGNFEGAPTVPLKVVSKADQQFRAEFGPVTLQARFGEVTVPVTVKGTYQKSGDYRFLGLSMATASEGKCRFGDKEIAVRVVDGDNNLRLGDKWKVPAARGPFPQVTAGDTLVVGGADGKFGKDARKFAFGSPVEVGGTWYAVKLSDDATKIDAEPLTVQAGKIQIDHPKWSCMLMGKDYPLSVSGGPEPVSVPAGEYVLMRYEEWSSAEGGEAAAHMTRNDYTVPPPATGPAVIEAGKTAKVAIGTPLAGTVTARKGQSREFTLALELKDASGKNVSALEMPGGQRPAEPKVTVRDSGGKEVYTNTLEYG
jgi:hypothetical protein